MATHNLTESDLISFSNVAAGHDGALSDRDGFLFIKPSTITEIEFYQSANADHPVLAALLPTFMGTLKLSSTDEKQSLEQQDPLSINAALQAQLLTDAKPVTNLNTDSLVLCHGKKIETDQAIVLENLTANFVKPNVLDVKLGARLWADDAPAAKRQKLEKVATETTSSTLGFRIAGMRVWQPRRNAKSQTTDEGEYKIYDKMYGRALTAANVRVAFEDFLLDNPATDMSSSHSHQLVLRSCLDELGKMHEVLESHESRMYSASMLFVVEGDPEALEEAVARSQRQAEIAVSESLSGAAGQNNIFEATSTDYDEEEEEQEESPRACIVKLIDFAHASWTPGQGPDHNVLQGITSVKAILESMLIPHDKDVA